MLHNGRTIKLESTTTSVGVQTSCSTGRRNEIRTFVGKEQSRAKKLKKFQSKSKLFVDISEKQLLSFSLSRRLLFEFVSIRFCELKKLELFSHHHVQKKCFIQDCCVGRIRVLGILLKSLMLLESEKLLFLFDILCPEKPFFYSP